MVRTELVQHVLIVALLIGVGAASTVRVGAVDAGDVARSADEAAQVAFDKHRLPALAVAVMRGTEIVLAKGYGLADVALGVPATPTTVFEVGSITKQFTAAAIMRLVERGLIDLEEPITTYLPDYPTQGHSPSVEQLLRHTSGIQDFIVMPEFWELAGDLDRPRDELVDMFKKEPFVFAPGARWAYSNSNYTLLGLIIEAATGASYSDFLYDTFFAPLGLSSTRVCDSLPGAGRAQGYALDSGVVDAAPAENMAWALGDGAICSSVVDLATWQHALVTGQVVRPESYERMISRATLLDGETPPYGFGLSLLDLDGRAKVAHSGRMGGFSGALAYYPEDDVTVAILTNLAGIEPEIVERAVARAVLGLHAPALHEVALPADRQRYVGHFDTGVFPLVIRDDGDRLLAEAVGLWPLIYQGDGTFVVEDGADAIRLAFGEAAQDVQLEFAGMLWYGRRVP